MHKAFASLPLPQQIHWGEETARCKDDFSIVKCLDIVGCRSNFFYERTRDIPVGCPLDEFEPAYVDGVLRRPLTDFEWLWLDTLEQQDYSDGFQDMPDLHRLYDGPHLYPLETVLFLIDDGFSCLATRTCLLAGRRSTNDLQQRCAPLLTRSNASGIACLQSPSQTIA